MKEDKGKIKTLKDKLIITADLTLTTGMHIGASNEFAPIGAVDSVVVRDPLTRQPIIPGSSLKGKMRTLLARTETNKVFLKEIEKDSADICRLFGSGIHDVHPNTQGRLQFFDLFIDKKSIKEFEDKTDLYLTEIKFENTINRLTSVANPRQIERVPAGMKFQLNLVYNLENFDDPDSKQFGRGFDSDRYYEVTEDFQNLARAFKLLQLDYIGGNGTRGYGRIKLTNFKVEAKNILQLKEPFVTTEVETILKEAENFALLSV